MSLKINGRNIQSLPLRFRGAVGFEYAETNKGSQRNLYASEGITDDASGNPAGHLYPSAWIWPQKSGSITSFKSIFGTSTFVGALALGLNGEIDIPGTSTFTATGFVTANLAADIAGTSTVTGAAAITLNGEADIPGTSDLTVPAYAVGFMSASIGNNTGTVYGIPFATGVITCSITPFTELSPQNLAREVWGAPVSGNTEPSTMGELLFSAGGGSSPSAIADAVWDALAADQTAPNSMGVLVKQLEVELAKRLKKTDFLALK